MKGRMITLVGVTGVLGVIVAVMYTGSDGPSEAELTRTLTSAQADSARRKQAAQGLARYPNAQSIDLLSQYVHDKDPAVAGQSLLTLGRIGDRRCVATIQSAMKDARNSVREAAVTAMGRMEKNVADKAALTAMVTGDDSPQVRAAAAKSLGQLDAMQSVPQLMRALRDPDVHVRRRAINAVRKILGVQFGYRASAEPAEREQAMQRIEAYWNRH